MNPLQKFVAVLTKPSYFWEEIVREKEIKAAVSYYALVCLAAGVMYSIIALNLLQRVDSSQIKNLTTVSANTGVPLPVVVVGGVALLFTFFFLAAFINAALVHVSIRLLKGQGVFGDTYRALAYGATPQLLCIGIPLLSLVSPLWMFGLQVNGLSKLHKLSTSRAVVAMLLGTVLLILIFLVLPTVIAAVLLSGR